jgi:hypothetical protein
MKRNLSLVLIAFLLTSCGGSGSGSSSTSTAVTSATTTTASGTTTTAGATATKAASSNTNNIFFVATSYGVHSFVSANPPRTGLLSGSAVGSNDLLGGASCSECIAYDSTNDSLYVASLDNTVLVFKNSSTAGPSAAPARTFSLPLPPPPSSIDICANYPSLFFDKTSDTLYAEVGPVSPFGSGAVCQFSMIGYLRTASKSRCIQV